MSGFRKPALTAEIKRMLRLSLPLVGAQLLQTGNGLVDTLVSGRLGSAQLAAGGIAAGIWFMAAISCIGLLAGLSPKLSALIGQSRRRAVGALFRQGLWLAALVGGLAMAIVGVCYMSLPYWSLSADLLPFIRAYLAGALWSLPAFSLIIACRNAFEAIGFTRPVLWVQALGLVVNTVANLGFGLGWFGLPKLGMFGIGISTTLAMVSMLLALLMFLNGRRFCAYALFDAAEWLSLPTIRSLLVLSLPIYLTLLFESGLFFATGVQMGMLGVLQAGAHSIAVSIVSICFMLPLGLSFAVTARVGRVYGRRQAASVRLRIVTAVLLMLVMALLSMTVLALFRFPLTSIYSTDPAIRSIAAQLLLLAAVFQLSDSAQVVLLGVCRGMQDTRVPMLINALSYWGIAFPLGYLAAHKLQWGANGLWFGLIVGLTASSLLLGTRVWKIQRAPFQGNVMDDSLNLKHK